MDGHPAPRVSAGVLRLRLQATLRLVRPRRKLRGSALVCQRKLILAETLTRRKKVWHACPPYSPKSHQCFIALKTKRLPPPTARPSLEKKKLWLPLPLRYDFTDSPPWLFFTFEKENRRLVAVAASLRFSRLVAVGKNRVTTRFIVDKTAVMG